MADTTTESKTTTKAPAPAPAPVEAAPVKVLLINNVDYPNEVVLANDEKLVLSPKQRVTVDGKPKVLPKGVYQSPIN